jgi:putative hydrolase of the HAD superfamily
LVGLSFDFWNTLYLDEYEDQRFALRRECFSRIVNLYRRVEEEEIISVLNRANDFFYSEWENRFRTPPARERLSFMCRELSIILSEEHIRELADTFGGLVFRVPPREIPGIKRQIPVLAQRYPLGLISDTGYISGNYIRLFLQKEGLFPYFNSFVFSDEQLHSKPHPSVFARTAANLQVPLNRLIHIGDMERTDIAGARGAGCWCIKYTGSGNQAEGIPSQAHRIISRYESLPDVLENLSERIRTADEQ